MIDILLNLISSFIGFLIAFFYREIIVFVQLRKLRSLWYSITKGKSIVVVVPIHGSQEAENTPFVGWAELMSYVELNKIFEKIRIQHRVVDCNIRVKDISDENWLLLGGILTNKIARLVWEKARTTMPFVFEPNTRSVTIADRTYTPEIVDGEVKKDYGVIVKIKHPYDASKNVLACAGMYAFGTLGCVKLITDQKYSEALKALDLKQPFFMLVEVIVKDEVMTSIQCVEKLYLPG